MTQHYFNPGSRGSAPLKTYSQLKVAKNSKLPFSPLILEEDKTQFEAVAKVKSAAISYFLKCFLFALLAFSTMWAMGQQGMPEKKKTAFIPNVCKNSISVQYADNSATITIDKLEDIRPGDKIRVLDIEKKIPFDAIVSSVRGNYFTIEGLSREKYGDNVFVYGKEVNDFRTVDYDALGMMNFTAIKKLTRQVEDQKTQIDNQQNEMVAMKSSIDKMILLLQDQSTQLARLNAASLNVTELLGLNQGKGNTEINGGTRFIPSVYRKALSVSYTENSAVITVDKLEDLKPGDKIKLYNEKNESYETTVATVNGNCFTIEKISPEMFGKNVFVYGKEVSAVVSEGL